MSLNNSTYTQSLGIPFTQYVTSSAGYTFISSSTYFNDTSDNLTRYKDANGNIIEPFVSASYALTASYVEGDGSKLTNLQRPISNSVSTNITASNLNAGFYFRVGGNITCSIQTSSLVSCNIGSEFEFFQTSSVGNMLFLSGSGVTLNSKSGNVTLTGQFSAATLKKIDNDEWDLIGDLS
jgi:hypothetical protein